MGSIIAFEWKLTMALCIMVAIADVKRGSAEFKKISCTCPGDNLVYDCNATGSGLTIWRGSAFDCPNVDGDSRIRLRHSSFGSGTTGLCNDGSIIGHSLGISRNSMNNPIYMSQLMINLTAASNILGQTVECVYIDPNGVETTIGSTTIDIIIADPLPPPTNIQLVGISSDQLVFNWTSVDSNCSTLQYSIMFNCGTCLDVVEGTASSVTCSIGLSANAVNMMLSQCSFGIQSVVCGDVSGNVSIPLKVTLKFPQSPNISTVVPHYNTNNTLMDFDIKFNEVEAFMISNRVDGSTLEYTIRFSFNTGAVCESLTILSSSCMKGVCTVPSINPLPCSEKPGDGDIEVSISAINRLGTGPPSVISIGRTNTYVNVTFQPANKKIICIFLHQQEGQGTISCDVSYGPCQQQLNMIARGTLTSPNTVYIDLSNNTQTDEYCYVVNANNGIYTVLVDLELEEMISSVTTEPGDESPNQINQNLVVSVTILTVSVLLIVVIAVAVICIIIVKRQNGKSESDINKNSEEQRELLPLDQNELEFESIEFNITFRLEDKPQEFMKVLRQLCKLKINFKNIKIGPCVSSGSSIVRQIYMECENDLTEELKQQIIELKIGMCDTLEVFCKAETRHHCAKQKRISDQKEYTITEVLEDKSGALLSLLNVIYSIKECHHINITNIDVQNDENTDRAHARRVIIMFRPDMAESWKEEYEKKRKKCKCIIKQPKRTISVLTDIKRWCCCVI